MKSDRLEPRSFKLLYLLTFLFFSANAVTHVTVPLQTASTGASNATTGIVTGAYMLACMVARPWAGYLVRRYGAGPLLRATLIAYMPVMAVFPFADPAGLLAVRLLQGGCTACFSMALQIGMIDALPEHRRAHGVSLYSLSTYAPAVVMPVAGIRIWEIGETFLYAGVMFALMAAVGTVGYVAVPHLQGAGETLSRDDGTNHRSQRLRALGNPDFLVCSFSMLAASVAFGAVSAFIPLYAAQLGEYDAGIFLALQAATVVTVRFVWRKRIPSGGRWPGRLIAGLLSLVAAASCLLALAGWTGPFGFYSAAVLMGIAQALLYPTLMTHLTFELPNTARNVLLGLFIASADLGVALGGIAMGPVADLGSYPTVYATCAGGALLAACLAVGREDLSKNQKASP